jgi:hypothetical protein
MPPILSLWLPIAIAVALTAVAMYQGAARRLIQTVLYVLAGIITTAAITWHVATVVLTTAVHPPSTLRRPVIKAWGTTGPFCISVIDGSSLADFQDRYMVAIACGIQDATVDKFEDKRITISTLFNLRTADITIAVPHSKEMGEALKKLTEDALKGVQVPKGMSVGVNVTVWYEAFLVPKGTELSAIHKLSDVPRVGVEILAVNAPVLLSDSRIRCATS